MKPKVIAVATPIEGQVMVRHSGKGLEIHYAGHWKTADSVVVNPRVPSTILADGMTVAIGVVRKTSGHGYTFRIDPS